MKRHMKTAVLTSSLLMLSLLLSGCWERQELNELAFVLGLGLDKAESGDYRVSFQIVIPAAISPQQTSSGEGNSVAVASLTVPTVYEAEREFTMLGSRQLYFGHIRVIVIGEELAREGVAESLEVFVRSREPRNDFYVVVAKEAKAEDVLSILTPLNRLPANKLFNSLDKSHKITAKATIVTLDHFIESLTDVGKSPVLTGVRILGDVEAGKKGSSLDNATPRAELELTETAVFYNDRLVDWLNEEETIGLNIMMDNVNKTSGPVMGSDGKPIVVEALHSTTKRTVKIIEGVPHLYFHVMSLCNIQDVFSTDNLASAGTLRVLEKKTEDRIIERMEHAADQIINHYNVDILGLGQLIYRHSPKTWAEMRRKYGDGYNYLKHIQLHYSADVRINRIGINDRSFLDDIKE